jgi:hypothetical protein
MSIKNISHNLAFFASSIVPTIFFKRRPFAAPNTRNISWGSKNFQHIEIPKIIWSYWNGSISATADACFLSLKESNKDFRIIDLNEENLSDYLPDLPNFAKDFPIQSISDFIRLSLLEKFGGIWIDRSVAVCANLNWIIDEAKRNKAEVVGFYNEHGSAYKKNHTRPIIETGCIAATRGSQFISNWLDNFKKFMLSDDWKNYYPSKTNYWDISSNFLDPTPTATEYFSVYLAAQETMSDPQKYRLFLINAEDEYYFYYYKTSAPLNRINFCYWILRQPSDNNLPRLIKLPKRYREMSDEYIAAGYANPLSVLGKYLWQPR